jgi:hypothetical protein
MRKLASLGMESLLVLGLVLVWSILARGKSEQPGGGSKTPTPAIGVPCRSTGAVGADGPMFVGDCKDAGAAGSCKFEQTDPSGTKVWAGDCK